MPVYFIRFEDLVTNPKQVLSEIFAFFLDVPSIKGMIIEKRIDDILQDPSSSIIYKPRVGNKMKT